MQGDYLNIQNNVRWQRSSCDQPKTQRWFEQL